MTYELEIQIEELRSEAATCNDLVERREIKAELECLQAELAVIVAEQDGRLDAEAAFLSGTPAKHVSNFYTIRGDRRWR